MDKFPSQESGGPVLHPPIAPFAQAMLDVGDGHRLHVEQCGNPRGIPVVVLHGGPGGGCSPLMRRFFDPRIYRVVLFDQRGCGRSEPHAAVTHNTTWHLVADIERIRTELGIDSWVVFGGSWGAALGLIYAQSHPRRVRALVLRGVFLMTDEELDWFYGGGAGRFFPDLWARFVQMVPEEERDDLIAAYHRRLFGGDLAEQTRFAQVWTGWENALASITSEGVMGAPPSHYARAFARLENHYFFHRGFLAPDQQILARTDRLADIPGWVVQGRYDLICPPVMAWRLCEAWPTGRLLLTPLSGHALTEPRIARELKGLMDDLPEYICA